jgi:hypothetical protein
MNIKKALLIFSFLVVLGFIFNLNIPIGKAMTVTEIQALIQQLQNQLQQLQQQILEIQPKEKEVSESCHRSSLWSWDYCSTDCKCDAGQGDCDGDFQCNTGYCALDVGAKYGKLWTIDVCEEKKETIIEKKVEKKEEKKIVEKPILSTCTDSDKGKDYFQKGETKDLSDQRTYSDYCTRNGKRVISCSEVKENCGIVENFCRNNIRHQNYMSLATFDEKCPFGCQDGACLKDIEVVLPNGGEEWEVENNYEISWISGGIEKVNIVLVTESKEITLATSVAASLGKFNWKIGNNLKELTSYKIRVEDADNIEFSDVSDDSFSVSYGQITNLICQKIDKVEFSGEMAEKGEIWLGFNWGYSFGSFTKETGWVNYQIENTENYPLEIHYQGSLYYGINYKAGILTFECDGVKKEVWLPQVSTLPAGGATVLYPANNGSSYYDKELTDLARRVGEKEKFITVTSPNGREKWQFGILQKITWQSNGVNNLVIYLRFSDGTICKLTDILSAENGQYLII